MKVREFITNSSDISSLVSLWNSAACDAFGYFPVTEELIARQVFGSSRFKPERLLLAEHEGTVVGMLHYDIVSQQYYEKAAVIEVVLVDKNYRRMGIASELMRTALSEIDKLHGIEVTDGGGSWPYSSFYASLIDGSERSGPLTTDHAVINLFGKFGFLESRKSKIMEWAYSPEFSHDNPNTYISAREDQPTWLDHIFRGWELYDHAIVDNGKLMSRCIYARMDGISEHSNVESYAVFGVNTPLSNRGKGWAHKNMSAFLKHASGLGAKLVQLHVYSDNAPAIGLYTKLGFTEVAETVMLRRNTP